MSEQSLSPPVAPGAFGAGVLARLSHAPAASPGRRLLCITSATLAALLAFQIALVLASLGGGFSYTLDDPYIHLTLADQIARGHYGLDPNAAAAPSSSIIYPFLLAGLSFGGLGQFAPLIVTIMSTLASGLVLAALAGEALPITATLGTAPLVGLLVLLATGLNLVGLALTGMEHSLHVAITLAWVLGTWRFLRGGVVTRWWWLCALAEPLIRYEGAAIWLATVVLLIAYRRRGPGLLLTAAGAAALAGFSIFLHWQGLPYLPSSVLVKSNLASTGSPMGQTGMVAHVLGTVITNLVAPNGHLYLGCLLLLVLLIDRCRRSGDRQERSTLVLAVLALLISLAHLAFGRLDAFSRYEIYVLALDTAVVMVGFSAEIQEFIKGANGRRWAVVLLACSVLFYTNIGRSWRSDRAALDIFEQQFQMHRLASEFYRGPVAVNDLGRVSYRNPYPVLDLWGLGSEDARLARKADPSGRWMGEVAARHGVGLAMIYDDWFPSRPAGWVPLARLCLPLPRVSAGGQSVTFYATGPERIPAVSDALDRFGAALPFGLRLDRIAPP